jgi:hypothetical protein
VSQQQTVPTFEPRIIEQFAESLYRKASAFLMGSVVAGTVLGMAFGAVPLTSLGSAWPVPSFLGFATMLLGGVFGGVIGYSIGDARSFGYRLQAQTTLLQLEMERNSAEAAYLLQLLVEGKRLPAEDAPEAPRASKPEPPTSTPVPVSAPLAAPRREPAPAPAQPPLSPPVSGPSVAAVR